MATSEETKKELKMMVALAKKGPINMAVCFGKKPENAVVMMDKKRKPEALGREAKGAGETAKIGIGTLTVDGKEATFTCADKPPSGLKKQLKLYFKSIDIKLDFGIIGVDGVAINEEGDDEPGAAADGETATAAPETDADTAPPVSAEPAATAEPELPDDTADTATPAETAPTTPDSTGPISTEAVDPAAIVERLKAARLRATAIPGPVGEKLNAGLQLVLGLLKSKDFTKAAGSLAKIEEALAKYALAQGATPNPDQTTDATPAVDPKFAKLGTGADQMRGQVAALPGGETADALNAILDKVADAIAGGEAEAALSGLKRVQDGLKLQAEVDRLAPLVANAAASGMVADVNALNLLFNWVSGKIPAPDHAKAMGGLAKVDAMLAAGAAQGKSAFAEELPLEIRPYATARLNWSFTRDKLKTEISRLEASIIKALADEGITDTSPVDGKLFAYIEKLDSRLEVKLGEIVNSDAGDSREKLKTEARSLIAEYRKELETDFFKDVDNNNGFTSVTITSSARDMLNDLSQVLAA